MFYSFNDWNMINESRRQSSATLIDIWRGYETLNYLDTQLGNSPLYQVQKVLISKLNNNPKTKYWVKTNGFKADNDFGKTTARALGLVLTGSEYKDPTNLRIGPNTLTKLGFKKPPSYSMNVKILATTLSVESGPNSTNKEVQAISNIIINRKKARTGYSKKRGENKKYSLINIVIDPSQFSLWDAYQDKKRTDMVESVMERRRPENNTNWNYCVAIAKKMLTDTPITDVTRGATHYFNPDRYVPSWGTGDAWIEHEVNLIHTFGRDTSTNWAKKPIS
jgi:hypothetical protein